MNNVKRNKLSAVIKVGSLVQIISGDDQGAVGSVKSLVYCGDNLRVIVSGVALSKRISKATKEQPVRSFFMSEKAIDISKVRLYISPALSSDSQNDVVAHSTGSPSEDKDV